MDLDVSSGDKLILNLKIIKPFKKRLYLFIVENQKISFVVNLICDEELFRCGEQYSIIIKNEMNYDQRCLIHQFSINIMMRPCAVVTYQDREVSCMQK